MRPSWDEYFMLISKVEEITSEKRWEEAFAQSQEQLSRLAQEALTEFTEGKTVPL